MRDADPSPSRREANTMAVEQGDSARLKHANDAHLVASRPAEEAMVEKRVQSVRIAVAEDEPDIRKTFVRLLELLGH